MGIKNLTTIIRHNAPNGINKIHLSEYRGKIIAIDTSIYLYKYIYNGNCLDGFVKQILRLFRNKIIPLYVFDGKPPEEKKEILNDRKQKRDQLILKKEELEEILEKIENNKKDISIIKQTLSNDIIEEPLDTEISKESLYTEMSKEEIETEIKKINKRIIKVSYINIENCKKLFNLFGVPYIVSDGEAEDLCSQLCSNGYVHGCMSEDTDILANGGLLFLRDFNSNNDYIIEYNLNKILNDLKITYNQFIDMCILCGCDYTSKIGKIGPINAYKYIIEYKNIESIILNIQTGIIKKGIIPDTFDYNKARELFKAKNETQFDSSNFKLCQIDKLNLLKFIKEYCSLNEMYINVIKNI